MTAQLVLNLDTLEEFSQILQVLKGLGWEHKVQIKAIPPSFNLKTNTMRYIIDTHVLIWHAENIGWLAFSSSRPIRQNDYCTSDV